MVDGRRARHAALALRRIKGGVHAGQKPGLEGVPLFEGPISLTSPRGYLFIMDARRSPGSPRQPSADARRRVGRTSLVGLMSGVSFFCVVAAVTLAIRAHDLPLAPFAASVAKIAAGEIWLLPASALVVDRPIYIGLVAFCLLGFAALRVCGAWVFWVVAVAGHIGSTLAAYSIIGASRLKDSDAFASVVARQDFGVSAVQGAWVGAIAATAWYWAGGHRARAMVAAGVCAVAGVAWWLHPDPSILTTEHLFAFFIGCGVVSWPRLVVSARTALDGLVSPRQGAEPTG